MSLGVRGGHSSGPSSVGWSLVPSGCGVWLISYGDQLCVVRCIRCEFLCLYSCLIVERCLLVREWLTSCLITLKFCGEIV